MFHCKKCDAQFPKWSGRCPECQAWGTVEEDSGVLASANQAAARDVAPAVPKPLDAGISSANKTRTGIAEVDRVLGGGIVSGSLLLLSGEPGVGKSTLVAALAARPNTNTLYVSGEESASQLASRFARLSLPTGGVHYLEAEPIETLIATIEKEKPDVAVIDSIQTVGSSLLDSGTGSATTVRYATNLLLQCAKRSRTAILVVGQVTKDGQVAGPKTLEHLVDVVLTLEGDPNHAFRVLRATKNRFGSTDEVGVFEMGHAGLTGVANPSERFLSERANTPGSVVTAALEGSRVFLVEVQALVDKSIYATPVRRASGFDANRLQMLCAILSRRGGVKLAEQDVYVNVIGGMNLSEPSADLAVCAAIASAVSGKTDAEPTVYFGEVGLGGEVRSVLAADRRLAEASRLGITHAVVPKKNAKKISDLTATGISTIQRLS